MKNRIGLLTATAIFLAVAPLISLAQAPEDRLQPVVVVRTQNLADGGATPGRLNALQLQRARRIWQQNYRRNLFQTNLQLRDLSKRRKNPSDQLDLTDQQLANTVNEPDVFDGPAKAK